MSDGRLPIWVVYDHPADFPSNFVARMHLDEKPTGNLMISPDLESIRDQLRRHGLVCMARHPDDDPKIVECWI
jgi:hypothetical protein